MKLRCFMCCYIIASKKFKLCMEGTICIHVGFTRLHMLAEEGSYAGHLSDRFHNGYTNFQTTEYSRSRRFGVF